MSKLATSRIPGSSLLRTRAAVVAVSLGASAFLGAGVAAAADTVTASALPKTTAASVAAQAEAQAKAATAAQASVTEAAAKKAGGWVVPVKGYTLSASYAQSGGMWAAKHSGQDFAVRTGTPVAAAGSGTVVKAGPNGAGDGPAYGNAIVIKHGNGTYSQYAHLSKINVRVGQAVKAGQKIALSGNTGNSSGPHLHFEIRTTPNYGSAINPAAFLRAHGVAL
ncbi:M23 family metallopeptidase [Streptomyces himalayensis]|uniref:M23 family metallopeptidase n=1 Tax=Streptomyces himalayensis subsp. himalayensis TaxID=2756131 RepID=A0A7W0DH73_9ACTN|nr:M23 family metallopeptidase [Streptomyces himalayensis]MBA2944982.1 M23 family metallopeptidase [Streptomyces himalayensis subsp. himalayensis]